MTTLNLTHKKGDTFLEMTFQILRNGLPENISGGVKMQLRKTYGGLVALDLSIGSGLTYINASLGTFKINTQIIDIEAYNYLYDIQTINNTSQVFTYISGVFEITNDVTR